MMETEKQAGAAPLERVVVRRSRWERTCNCCLILITGLHHDSYPEGFVMRMMERYVNNGGDILPDADCEICGGTGEIPAEQLAA
jgi:hypothetical protein